MPSGLTPAVDTALLNPGDPFDEDLATNLAAADEWSENGSTVGTGIKANAAAFETAFNTGHSHDGTAGQGKPVPAAGILNGSVNASDMFDPLAVTTGKIAGTTVGPTNIDNGAVTPAKMDSSASMGTAFSGTVGYDLDNPPLSGTDAFDGETKTITHGLGRRPVICNRTGPDFHVRSTSSTTIVLAINKDYVSGGGVTRTGTWAYGLRAC